MEKGLAINIYCTPFNRQVPPTMKCLSEVMYTCDKKIQGLLSMVVDHIGETSGALCKAKDCNMELASMCMTEVGAMLKLPPQTYTQSSLWCG